MKKYLSGLLSVLLIFVGVMPVFSSVEKTEYHFTNIINKDILNSFKVTDSYDSNNNNNFVIWIQDLHNDFVTQNKIYKALENLTEKHDFKIYGEGVVDKNLDISILNSIPDKRIKKEIIDNLFKTSVLSACEYFALSNANKNINGIENKKEYLNNLLLLEKINKNKDFNNYIINNISNKVTELKQKSILDRVLALQILKLNDADIPDNFPNLQKYQTISKNLSNIDSKKLNSQFKNFLLQSKNYSTVYHLLSLKTDYGYAQVYDYIDNNLPELKESKKNKELMMYLQSNKLLFEINTVNLLYEKEYYINSLLNNEFLDQNEREIIDLDNYVKLLKDLVNVNILPSHYKILKENKKYFTELLNKYLSNDLLAFALYLLNDKDIFDFFDTNIDRNEIFIENLLDDSSDKIIVAGGFHSDITNKLKQAKISYVVLTPNISFVNAFNNLFSTTLKYGTNEQIAANLLSIISSWQMFFSDTATFQNEINEWIKNNDELKGKLSVIIESKDKGFDVSVTYADATISKSFDRTQEKEKQVILSKKQQNLLVDDIIKIAKQHYLFGENVEVIISDDDNLLDNMLPMSVKNINKKSMIFINKKFINALYLNPYLIQSAVKLLYYSTAEITDTDSFISFVSNNYEDLQTIYDIATKLKDTKPSLLFTIKTKFKKFINNIKASIGNFNRIKTIKEISEEEITTEDEKYMAEALKQSKLARQTRSFLVSFIQPPIGAFIINADGVKGKNYNDTKSVLHAETLTFIDFLKNYIQVYEKLPAGELTEKGRFLTELLELARINGENINNKTFQDRPFLLENLGIHIDYSQKRNIDMVFAESNAVLKYVSLQLGNPLASATLYCTLAPCNKCAKTMAALGIDRLVYGSYSANKGHKSINNILKAGIKVVDGILQKQCDERIVNYRFMNLSVFRTKIASSIQIIRRFFSNFSYNADKNLNHLISNISTVGKEFLNLKYTILDLQRNINWSDLQSDPKLLENLINLLKQIDAYDDVVKRASIMYVIRNGCEVRIENGNIVFYNKDGKKLDFYINVAGKMVVSKNYADRMKKLAEVRNFADMDDNLALRDSPFNADMQAVFSILTLYGIGQPVPITGNTLLQTEKRLNPLGDHIRDLVHRIYIENAALQCDIEDGGYVTNQDYMDNVAQSTIDRETMSYLKDLFGNMQQEWYDIFVDFINKTKQLRNQENVTYEDFINLLLEQQSVYKQFESVAEKWGHLTREEAIEEINSIYQTAINSGISIEKFKETMKIMSLFELARLYFSKDSQDKTEAVRLQQDIEAIEKGENLCTFTDSPVRFVVTAFRPTVVRAAVADYFRNIIQQKYPELEVVSTGQTTISVYKKGINKSIPLRVTIKNGIPASSVIFTGDEFNVGGVDYPIYLLQQQQGNGEMVVINTNSNSFNGEAISLREIDGFSTDSSSDGNVRRNLLLQKLILSIVEENIGLIATDPEYEPVEVAQELKSRLFSQNVIDFESQAQQPDIINVADMLKAG
ncbi:MAG: hypothetical protein IKN42_07035 [Elusimicrobia bacterium]|nr:hypothetical protein [Elusimicrobiota bacterium]